MEEQLLKLQQFIASAPSTFSANDFIKRYALPNSEIISCVYWKGNFFVTGTDIVKILTFRFQTMGRHIINQKKFEEGIFSDLRNLKPGVDSVLEHARSEFLEMLYKNGCVRTQKKQKVFFWYSVPHEILFKDALERDIKRENQSHTGSNVSGMTPSALKNSAQHAAAVAAAGGYPLFCGGPGGGLPINSSGYQSYHGHMANTQQSMINPYLASDMYGVSTMNGGGKNSEYYVPSGTIDPLNLVVGFHSQSIAPNSANTAANGSNGLTSCANNGGLSMHGGGGGLSSAGAMGYMQSGAMAPSEQISIVFDDPSLQELFDNVMDNRDHFSASTLSAY